MTETYLQWIKRLTSEIIEGIKDEDTVESLKEIGFALFGASALADVVFVVGGLLHPVFLFYLIAWFFGLTYISYRKSRRDC